MLSPSSSTLSSPMRSPGSVAAENVQKIKDLAIFKKPINPPKRKKFKVLDEDAYVEKIGEIIQRDFFPDLEKLQAQNDYIDAVENNDTKKMRELYEKYSFERPTTERLPSPATFETPVRRENPNSETPISTTSSSKESESKKPKTDEKKMGLDAFLSNHTSEDNASFEDIMEENEKKHRIKYAWLYKEETNPEMLSIENSNSGQLAIENGKRKSPLEIKTWGYKNKNYIMYIPDGAELTSEEQVEFLKNRKEIVHASTRLKVNPFNEQQNKETISELAKIQSKTKDGKIGVDGKEIVRSDTPKVRGYSFLATPTPSIPEGIMDSPIMTWGQIEGTPFRLDGGDTPLLHTSQGPSFRMAEPPKREKIAWELAEKAAEKNRDKKMKALNAARRSLAT